MTVTYAIAPELTAKELQDVQECDWLKISHTGGYGVPVDCARKNRWIFCLYILRRLL